MSKDDILKLLNKDTPKEPPSTNAPVAQGASSGTCSCCAPPASSGAAACCGGAAKGRKVVTALLLAFVAFSIVAMIVREMRPETAAGADAPALEQTDAAIVYYFHGSQRCFTCNRIEELTKAAIEENFSSELALGSVVMQSVNLDEKANEHFIEDFQLTARSVVIKKGGAHETFDQVWTLVREPDQLKEYIRQGVERMLAK